MLKFGLFLLNAGVCLIPGGTSLLWYSVLIMKLNISYKTSVCKGTPVEFTCLVWEHFHTCEDSAFWWIPPIWKSGLRYKKDYLEQLGDFWGGSLVVYLLPYAHHFRQLPLQELFYLSNFFSLGTSRCSWTFSMTAVKLKMKAHRQEAGNGGCLADWPRSGTALSLLCPTYSMQMWTVVLCTQ